MEKEQIKKARVTLGFTQKKMSELMGVNIKLWQKWEYGSQGISAAPAKFLKLLVVLYGLGILRKCMERVEG